MKLLVGFVALALAPFSLQQQHVLQSNTETQSANIDAYIFSEWAVAKAGILANIGPNGSKSQGAKSGVVVASPSTSDPNYLYTWTRDSSLVFKTLVDLYIQGVDSSLRGHIDDFVAAESKLQQVSNPSGTVVTGGLGEPKFNIDLSAFTEPWGRPQRDGPALRATTLGSYADWLIGNSNKSYAESTLWPLIKLDLDYVVANWNQTTFDLWEEISSSSFFTAAVQHRSLRQGASLASALSQPAAVVATYTQQADNVLCFMQSFWNFDKGYVTANTGGGRSGIDVNTVLASIHTFDADAGCDASTLQPCSDKALSNLLVYVNSFRDIYKLNDRAKRQDALATGRYFEDVYFGGNPWYLATFAVAEQLYDALQVWTSEASLTITPLSLPFFSVFSNATTGTYSNSTSVYHDLVSSIQTYADAYLALAAKYTPGDGGLAEQYTRDTGAPLSAHDLTWSYASAITAFGARNGTGGASWGAAGLKVPTVCGGGGGPKVAVTFNVLAFTTPGENIYITGSVTELKNWSPDQAFILSADDYPSWKVTINLPANSLIDYKYFRKFNGQITWESDPNNQITTAGNGSTSQFDVWR